MWVQNQENCRLYPSVFSEEDFVSISMLQSDNGENLFSAHRPNVTESSYTREKNVSTNSKNFNLLISCQRSCSKDTDRYSQAAVFSLTVSTKAVSPLPLMCLQTTYRKSRAKQYSTILTGISMKISLGIKAI
jgi:hypothetical protein